MARKTLFRANDAVHGRDLVSDFSTAEGDRIRLHTSLRNDDTLSVADVVARFAAIHGTDTRLDFDGGETLRIRGFTDLAELPDHIDIISHSVDVW